MPFGGNPRRLLIAVVVLGLLLSVFFGVGAARSMIRIAATGLEAGKSDAESIRGWMTVPYIARVFELPAEELYARIGAPQAGSDKKSLQTLNKEYFPGKRGYLVAKAKEAVRGMAGLGPRTPDRDP